MVENDDSWRAALYYDPVSIWGPYGFDTEYDDSLEAVINLHVPSDQACAYGLRSLRTHGARWLGVLTRAVSNVLAASRVL